MVDQIIAKIMICYMIVVHIALCSIQHTQFGTLIVEFCDQRLWLKDYRSTWNKMEKFKNEVYN